MGWIETRGDTLMTEQSNASNQPAGHFGFIDVNPYKSENAESFSKSVGAVWALRDRSKGMKLRVPSAINFAPGAQIFLTIDDVNDLPASSGPIALGQP